MTISSDTNKIGYTGDNATVEFIYDFLVPLVADMTVTLDDVIQSTGYTVNGAGNDAGGNVTFDVAPGAGVNITLIRELDITQEMDLRPYDAFPADTVEDAFDKLTMISQDIQEQVDRSVTAPVSDDGSTDYTMPLFQAGSAITWDDPTKQLVNSAFPLQQYVDGAATSESNAAASAAQAADRASVAQLRAWDSEANQLTSDSYATKAEDVFVTIYTSNGDGTFTATPSTDYSALHWAAKALENGAEGEANTNSNLGAGEGLASAKVGVDLPIKSLVAGANISLVSGPDIVTIAASASASGSANIPSRNCVLNQDPVTQALSSEAGQESLLGTATSAVDTTTGDRGFIRFSKDRNNATSWVLSDSIRGAFHVQSDTTAAEIAGVPTVDVNDVTFTFQTNKKVTGTTNRGKAYTCHYNASLGISAITYEGDGVAGHEIPHHLTRVPELILVKDLSGISDWLVQSSLFSLGDSLKLQSTEAVTYTAALETVFSNTTISFNSGTRGNASGNRFLAYNFTSIVDVSKISTYTGTGAAGNEVVCGFRPGYVMLKSLDSAADWITVDSARGDNNNIRHNDSGIEVAFDHLDFTPTGFVLKSGTQNILNESYIFMAFVESSSDANKTVANYNYLANADTLEIVENSLLSFANGFDANGQVDTQENVGAGVTHVLGVGFESKTLWLYKDLAGSYGTTEVEPVEGLTKGAATGDYYLVEEGVMYNSSDVAIDRVYLAEVITDGVGDVSSYTNLPVAKQNFTEVEVHKDLIVHGSILNIGVATALVVFDGTQSPPLIISSANVSDIVDISTGQYDIVFATPMDTGNYSMQVTGTWDKRHGGNATTGTLLDKARVISSDAAASMVDDSLIFVAFFGGKN